LNCTNGTVDLRTGELLPHDRGHLITKSTGCEYPDEPGIDTPTWSEFLETTFAGRTELVRYVQKIVGVAIVGQVIEHILPICYGQGSNGKSTLLESIMGAMGEYAISAAPALLMVKPHGDTHPTEVADLHGVRLAAVLETEDNQRLSEALVKRLTGGDKIRARRMRQDFWEFSPSHTFVMATNHRPRIHGQDHAIWRRLRLIPFLATIPDDQQDKQLPQKLRAERSGILKWCVEGCLAWQREGLGDIQEVSAATNEYRHDSDILAEFFAERCELVPELKVKSAELYGAYSDWAEYAGEKRMTRKRLGDLLRARGFEKFMSDGAWWRGLGLRPVDSE
jgi:putative DNA primase/helicase